MASGGRPHHPDLRCGNRLPREAATRLAGGDSRPARRARARWGDGGAAGDRHRGGARARAAPPLVAGQRRPRRHARACRLEGSPGRLRAGAVSSTGLIAISEKARRWRNILYLRVEEIEGADTVELAALRDAARRVNEQRIIDYDEVFRLKSLALESIFRAAPNPQGLNAYVRRQGAALRDFATFNCICEMHGPAWRSWPRDVGRVSADRVAYHPWLPFHADRQLARASRGAGLITDVPGGFASDGFDAWRWRDHLSPGIRVGAPPDEFFRDGQGWGLPAFNPRPLGGASAERLTGAIGCAA